jgi:hypothetical protein
MYELYKLEKKELNIFGYLVSLVYKALSPSETLTSHDVLLWFNDKKTYGEEDDRQMVDACENIIDQLKDEEEEEEEEEEEPEEEEEEVNLEPSLDEPDGEEEIDPEEDDEDGDTEED